MILLFRLMQGVPPTDVTTNAIGGFTVVLVIVLVLVIGTILLTWR